MHSGFGALRSHCPMNIEADAARGRRARAAPSSPASRADLARIDAMWSEAAGAQRRAVPVRRLRHRRRLLRAGVLAHAHLRACRSAPTSPRYIDACSRCRRCRPGARRRSPSTTSSPTTSRTGPARVAPALERQRRSGPESAHWRRRTGAQRSQRDLRRRAMKPMAPRPASISAYVSGSGTALIDSTLTAMSL